MSIKCWIHNISIYYWKENAFIVIRLLLHSTFIVFLNTIMDMNLTILNVLNSGNGVVKKKNDLLVFAFT